MNILFLVCKEPVWIGEYLRRNCSVQRQHKIPEAATAHGQVSPDTSFLFFFQLEILSRWNLAIFYIFFWQTGWVCWFACMWRDSAGNHAHAETTCACAAPYLNIYFCWQHLIKIEQMPRIPATISLQILPLGLRQAVFCYRITAWWSLERSSGDWLVQCPSSKQGQQKQLFASALHNLSRQFICSSVTATVKKNPWKIWYLNAVSCIQFVP